MQKDVSARIKNFQRLKMLKVFKRSLTQDLKISKGIWADFSNRSESLKIKYPAQHQVNHPDTKPVYHAPSLINETFEKAYNLLQDESQSLYQKAEAEEDPVKKERLLIRAESKNPEVLYNMEYNSTELDVSQPVYRNFAKKQWQGYDLMVLMQRLEQFKVIPDTLPTLVPQVDVKLQFSHNTSQEFKGWIEPGQFLPAFAVSQPPTIKIQQFHTGDIEQKQRYTIVLVNPDDPDLDTNSFKTTLNFGVSNVTLDLKDNTLDIQKYLSGDLSVFRPYQPLLPEMNAGEYQRACLWVFKQSEDAEIQVDLSKFDTEKFDIREFASSYNLQAVGAHMWRQAFDRSVNKVRSDYGLPKGRVFHRVRKSHPLI